MALLREMMFTEWLSAKRVPQEPAEVFAYVRHARQVEERAVSRHPCYLLESEDTHWPPCRLGKGTSHGGARQITVMNRRPSHSATRHPAGWRHSLRSARGRCDSQTSCSISCTRHLPSVGCRRPGRLKRPVAVDHQRKQMAVFHPADV